MKNKIKCSKLEVVIRGFFFIYFISNNVLADDNNSKYTKRYIKL